MFFVSRVCVITRKKIAISGIYCGLIAPGCTWYIVSQAYDAEVRASKKAEIVQQRKEEKAQKEEKKQQMDLQSYSTIMQVILAFFCKAQYRWNHMCIVTFGSSISVSFNLRFDRTNSHRKRTWFQAKTYGPNMHLWKTMRTISCEAQHIVENCYHSMLLRGSFSLSFHDLT